MEAVSKLGTRSKSCHDLDPHVFRFPHPNPLPDGEGATCSRCTTPSPFGRGTQGEDIRATMTIILRVLRQPPCRAPTTRFVTALKGHFQRSSRPILVPVRDLNLFLGPGFHLEAYPFKEKQYRYSPPEGIYDIKDERECQYASSGARALRRYLEKIIAYF
jgi:hypothetical protein